MVAELGTALAFPPKLAAMSAPRAITLAASSMFIRDLNIVASELKFVMSR
jgi:hypothetical protein